MEGLKDVIVSQPPAMYTNSGYATSISLENYKGILLCDRPAPASSFGGSAGAGSPDGKGFAPAGTVAGPLGLGPSTESQAQRQQREAVRLENQRSNRAKSHQALSRHRRWLHSFAQQMKHMKAAEREQQVQAAEMAQRLREAELQRRQEQQRAQQSAAVCADCGHSGTAKPSTKNASTAAGAGKKKPKWAMTEDEALDDELAMNDDLLAFAKNLDYDKFISDLEVTEALTVMRDRVQEIARANHWTAEDILHAAHHDADDDLSSTIAPSEVDAAAVEMRRVAPTAPSAARPAMAGAAATHDAEWDASSRSSRGRVLKRAISSDALALAERLLAASPSMQKIYTRNSLAKVLQRCALEGQTDVSAAALVAGVGRGEAETARRPAAGEGTAATQLAASTALGLQADGAGSGPKVVQISAGAVAVGDGGDGYAQPRVLRDMQTSKERTQGLPYLYRCPAI